MGLEGRGAALVPDLLFRIGPSGILSRNRRDSRSHTGHANCVGENSLARCLAATLQDSSALPGLAISTIRLIQSDCRVQMLKFDASIFGGELPVGLGVVGIAVVLPGGDFVDEDLFVGNAAIEALGR